MAIIAFTDVVFRRGGVFRRGEVGVGGDGGGAGGDGGAGGLWRPWAVDEVSVMASSELEIDKRGDPFRAELIHHKHPDAKADSQCPYG